MPTGSVMSAAVSVDALHQIRTARALMAVVGPAAQAAGLSLEGFLVLAALSEVTPQGLSMTELAKATGATAPTLTRHVDTLATHSLIYREVDLRDRRSTLIYVSKLGTSRLQAIDGRLAAARR